jgi:hypothetical protein
VISCHQDYGRVVGHPDQHVDPKVSFLDGGLVRREVTTDNEKVRLGKDCVSDEPFQTLCSILEVSVFLDVYISAVRDFHPHPTPSLERLAGPTLVNKNRFHQQHDAHDHVGENKERGITEYPMGGIEIETDEQQQNDSHQSKMILKPLLQGIHGSPLPYFEVVGLKETETCQIYRGK